MLYEVITLLSRLSSLTEYISNSEILNKIKSIKESITGGSFSTEEINSNFIVEKKKKTNIEDNTPASEFFNRNNFV